MSVCVYYCRGRTSGYYKADRGGGRRRVDDMCYDRRRAMMITAKKIESTSNWNTVQCKRLKVDKETLQGEESVRV